MHPRSSDPAQPDLKQRILEAAEHLLEAEGLAALSMREVARRSGVTHQAPYHHFADREAILAELVMRGFTELTARLAQANEQIPAAGRLEAGIASGLAYVGYAIDHPGASIDHGVIFGRYLERMRNAYFEEHRGRIAAMIRDMLSALQSEGAASNGAGNGEASAPPPLDREARERALAGIARLKTYGYCEHCARASLGELLEERYA